jgi:hypothetical protein
VTGIARKADRRRARPNRLGDLIRVMWKVPGKTRGQCTACSWEAAAGISLANAARNCREHTRETGHATRLATVEIVEYRKAGCRIS